MNIIAVVDTHALIWFMEGNPQLGKKAAEILTHSSSKLILPVIVLCELYSYLKKKRNWKIIEQFTIPLRQIKDLQSGI